MIPACIFTYAGGALVLPWTVRLAIRAGFVPVVCQDAAAPLPPHVLGRLRHDGVEVVNTTFPRRGNLNGTDCAAGICRTLAEAAERHGSRHALKLDDDTAVIDPRVFTRHRHARAVGLTWPAGRPGAYGMAYLLRADVARAVAASLVRGAFRPDAPEDITIWETAKRLGPVVERRFRARKGPFSALPLHASAEEAARRFDVLNVGTPPATGWGNRPAQIEQGLRRVAEAIVTSSRPDLAC